MGLIRLLIFALIGYFLYKMIKRLLTPPKQNPNVYNKSDKENELKKRNDIQDIDYEDIE